MTRIVGARIMAAPCCGAHYSAPQYGSMNFSAFEYWTDGWREGSLMPNDEGLRRCKCGQFLLMSDLVEIRTAAESDLPRIDGVYDDSLADCIAKPNSLNIEVAARLMYWRTLNHPYRTRYRLHRNAEEAATQSAWEKAHPDRRTWWDRLLRRKPPAYVRSPESPFTVPPFEPSGAQMQNMQRLCELLEARRKASVRGYCLELIELYREQGLFDDARRVMSTLGREYEGPDRNVMDRMIDEKEAAPIRFRM
jgi:hypothetical protein